MLTLHYHHIEGAFNLYGSLVSMVPFATKGKDRSQVKTGTKRTK